MRFHWPRKSRLSLFQEYFALAFPTSSAKAGRAKPIKKRVMPRCFSIVDISSADADVQARVGGFPSNDLTLRRERYHVNYLKRRGERSPLATHSNYKSFSSLALFAAASSSVISPHQIHNTLRLWFQPRSPNF